MAATDTLNSLDATLARARQEYEAELTELKSKLVQAQADACAARDMLEREGAKATAAIQTAATLVAHFGTVGKVFDDARVVAEKAKSLFASFEAKVAEVTPKLPSEAETVSQKSIDAVEAALHNHLDQPTYAQTPPQ